MSINSNQPITVAPEVYPSATKLAPPTPVRGGDGKGEAYWKTQLEPLVMQMTHRKNDYGTILSFLKSVDPETSPLVVSMEEAAQIPREVGNWFIVVAEERAVVRLGIGTNPGLKKYYWRANGSKRLLKREMEDDGEPADLVYIIQKAHSVSKRCVSLPDDRYWLVMYLPSTLRAAKGALASSSPSSSKSTTGVSGTTTTTTTANNMNMKNGEIPHSPLADVGPTSPGASHHLDSPAVGPTRKRKRVVDGAGKKAAATKKPSGPSSSFTHTKKKGVRKNLSAKLKKKGSSGAKTTTMTSSTRKYVSKKSKSAALAARLAAEEQERAQHLDDMSLFDKMCESYNFQQTASEAAAHFESDDDEEEENAYSVMMSADGEEENIIVDILDDDHTPSVTSSSLKQQQQQQQEPPQHRLSSHPSHRRRHRRSAGPSFQDPSSRSLSPLDPPSEDEALFADLYGEGVAHELLAAYSAPPPPTSKAVEPDPFLPLAGFQTGFSAALEAACMSATSSLPSSSMMMMELPYRVLPSTVPMSDFEPVF